MTKNKFFKQFVVLLALIAAGAQGALAQTPDFTINGVGYSYCEYRNFSTTYYYASVMSYTGTAETLTIPDSVTNGSKKYRVENIGGYYPDSSNNSVTATTVTFTGVKTLTIQQSSTLRGTIKLPDAETLVFEKSFNWASSASPITCPKLTEIYFKGSTPSLSGSGSKYFADGRIGSITAYVAGKTQEECDQMKATQAVWCEFKDVRPYAAPDERKVNVYVTAERTWVQVQGKNDGAFLVESLASSGSIQSETITIDKYSDFSVKINKYGYSDHAFRRILVNGKDVSNELTWYDDYAWSGEYYIRDITEDTYIHIDGETKTIGTKMFMTVSEGGSVTVTVDGKTHSYGSTFFELQPNSQLEIIISPIDGYELHKVYLGGRLEVAPYNSVSNELGIQDLGDGRYKIAYSMDRFRYWWNDREDPSYTITFKPKALPTWTVVQTDNTVDSELLLTRGFIDEVVACDNPITTQAFGSDVEKVKLRIPMAGEAGSTLRVLFFRDGEGLMLTPFDTVNEMGNPTTIFVSNGSDVTSLGTVADGYLNFEFSAAKLANATWVITTEPEMSNPTWTVVKTDNATVAEVVVTDSVDTVLPCTDPFTTQTINPENLTKATLRVATTGESSEYSVYLVNSGSNKVTVIGVVRELTGMGLKDAKALVDSADGTTPILVATFPTAAEAQAAKEALEAAGATVQVEGDGTPTRVFRDGVDVTAQGTADGNYLCFEVSPDNLANTTWVITTEPVMPDPFDVNGDGVIDTKDATIVIDKYLNQ